jgi:hypothetical protein
VDKRVHRGWLALFLPGLAMGATGCPPEGWDRARLDALKEAKFVVADDAARNALALGLLACLADRDPALRDGIGFDAQAHWLRADALAPATRQALLERLLPVLVAPDPDGVHRPFAALVLSEVARTDRKSAWMAPAQRAALVDAASAYMAAIVDHRGFDETEGWRHGVAHTADLMMQLALNPALDKAQLDRMLAAIATQVAPAGHFYVYGEPERLARPVLFAAARGLHADGEWQAWLDGVVASATPADPASAFRTQAGLAQRHDLKAFLLVLYANARESTNPALVTLASKAAAALAKLE